MSLNPKPTFVTFDCYGTLIDWDAGSKRFFQEILLGNGARISLEDFHDRWNQIEFDLIRGPYKPYKEILAESLRLTLSYFGLPCRPDDEQRFSESIRSWSPFPDVGPNLKKIKRAYKIAIISNIDDDIIQDSVKGMGVEFDDVITAQQARAYKPNPHVFRYALSRLGCKAFEILHAAFGYNYDIIPARKEGMRTVWVNRRSKEPEGKADFVVNDLTDLSRLVL